MDPSEVLNKCFFETSNFKGMIWLKSIDFHSVCEHHMLPISGKVDICYVRDNSVVGISKLARIVEVFARRMQLQERFTAQIATSIQTHLNPKGVGVRVKAVHYCMKMRGVMKNGSTMETTHFTGIFESDRNSKFDFFNNIN